MIESFASLIPKSVLSASGAVFYSGRTAFSATSKLYILGLNPGGSPVAQAHETVELHTNRVLNDEPAEWSAYRDESWTRDSLPGTSGLQPRVQYMLRQLDIDPRLVPSSNVIFVRSARESTLPGKFAEMAEETWAFHQSVIERLGIRVVLCFGKSAGNWIAGKLAATREVDTFTENNKRHWKTIALSNKSGVYVLIAAHPSRADWTVQASDPSPLVRRVMEQI